VTSEKHGDDGPREIGRENSPGLLVIATLLICLVVAVVPAWVWREERPAGNSIISNLRIIEGAKDQWAIECKKEPGSVPTLSDLAPYLKGGEIPQTGVKEKYSINPVGTPASATAPVKLGTYPAGSTILAQ
jgi:hypothetical protein